MSQLEKTDDVADLIAISVWQNRIVRVAHSDDLQGRIQCDEGYEGEADAGEEIEMWGSHHCGAGTTTWRIHLVR